MTIDERLEALTHSVELMAGIQQDQAKETAANLSRLDRAMAELAKEQAKTEKMLRGFGRYAMAIAHDHEKRIFDLENPEI
jgi:hypothetical protein